MVPVEWTPRRAAGHARNEASEMVTIPASHVTMAPLNPATLDVEAGRSHRCWSIEVVSDGNRCGSAFEAIARSWIHLD